MNGQIMFFDIRPAVQLLDALIHRTHESIMAAGGIYAQEMESYAKQNAPWTDRTGNARRTLFGLNTFGSDDAGDSSVYYIGVGGAMPYSPELELRHRGKYAILHPTLELFAPTLLENIRDTISRQEGLDVR